MEKDQLSPVMDNEETSSNELGQQRCSDLEVPLFVPETFTSEVRSYLRQLTERQWLLLGSGNIDDDTIMLLSGMCLEIVEESTSMVLEDVLPQVQEYTRTCDSVSSNTSVTMNRIDTPVRNYERVTEDDIQASIGNSLHVCIGAVLGVEEESSHDSDKLLELVAAEVTRRVNLSLAANGESPSPPQSQDSSGSDISYQSRVDNMVYHAAYILKSCILKLNAIIESQDSDFSDFSSPDEITTVEEFSSEDAESIYSLSESSVHSFQIIEDSPSPTMEVSQRENISGQKSTGRTSSFVKKVRRFFNRRNARVAPGCEVAQLENRSTPPTPIKRQRPAITRIFASMARILRPFTSCTSSGSQDD